MKIGYLSAILIGGLCCISSIAWSCGAQTCTQSQKSTEKGRQIYSSYICCQPTDTAIQPKWFANASSCENFELASSQGCSTWKMCTCN